MPLTTVEYFCFLVLLFLVFWHVAANRAVVWVLILTANVCFYASWAFLYAVAVPAAAVLDYFLAQAIGRSGSSPRRRLYLCVSIAVNLGLLLSTRIPGGLFGWILPLSLSFYAFQALTYTIDVYRGDARPAPNLAVYLASVLFFPTTLAGPITRVASLLPQWDKLKAPLDEGAASQALYRIAAGAAKKFLVADYLAEHLVNRVFDTPGLYSGAEVLLGVYGYAFQLYYDFSGYTDIALGSAQLFGLRLPENFNRPYTATSIADFWRRWHMSFSSWLRDYLYFALPGHRTAAGPYAALIFTMLLAGLWHGLTLSFALWGLWHGFGLALTRFWQSQRRAASTWNWARLLSIAATFHFVVAGWILFRAETPETAWLIVQQIAGATAGAANVGAGYAVVLAACAALVCLPRAFSERAQQAFTAAPSLVQAAILAALTVGIQYLSGAGAAPFVYQKF